MLVRKLPVPALRCPPTQTRNHVHHPIARDEPRYATENLTLRYIGRMYPLPWVICIGYCIAATTVRTHPTVSGAGGSEDPTGPTTHTLLIPSPDQWMLLAISLDTNAAIMPTTCPGTRSSLEPRTSSVLTNHRHAVLPSLYPKEYSDPRP